MFAYLCVPAIGDGHSRLPPVAQELTFSGSVTHAFGSRLSSWTKRQSVLSLMIVLGLDLIMPASWSRSA
jgi:hypothetical protein